MYVIQLSKDHIDDLVYLTHSQVTETLSHMPYEEYIVRAYAEYFAEKRDESDVRVYLLYSNERPVGYLVLYVKEYLFCDSKSVGQEVIYVLPEYRGTKAAAKLIKKLDEVGRQENALEIYGGIANGYQPERTLSLFSRLGYEQVGYYVRKIV